MTDFTVRAAVEKDLPALAEFEAEIARISFADDAIDDLAVQEKKLAKAMARSADGMLVACAPDDTVVGWLWITVNTNPMSGQRYANFRSLAMSPADTFTEQQRAEIGEDLLDAGLEHVRADGVEEVVGRVAAGNVPMRLLYRKFGFNVAHLTMRLDTRPPAPAPEQPPFKRKPRSKKRPKQDPSV